MNKLELAMSGAVRRAHEDYYRDTESWLFHAPEHYLQNAILLKLGGRSGFSVFAEATRKKVAEHQQIKPPGPRPLANTRHDLTIWGKSTREVRAVVEIKRAMDMNAGVRRDFDRVSKAVRGRSRHAPKTGYVLVYSEARKSKTLPDRFHRWAEETGYVLVNDGARLLEDDTAEGGWACGFGLFRHL